MYKIISEGKALIYVPKTNKISKKMDVFYNSVMKFNRDISILLLNSIEKKKLRIALPLAGTGIRAIRFLKELEKNKIDKILVNDYKKKAINIIKRNFKLNKLKIKKHSINNEDANLFLLKSKGFDYIDIDPFGNPSPYLDSSLKRISRNGILAVTATDTSALAGSYPKACLRKYWAIPLRNELMHEIGLRILIRKIQLIGSQYGKALIPMFSYFKDHYMRVFFRCEKSKEKTDLIMKQHGMYKKAGPLWKGHLWDKELVGKMLEKNKIEENKKFLNLIKEESKIDVIGFYNIHKICKRNKLKIPKLSTIIEKIKKINHKASCTHFDPVSIRSDIDLKRLIKIIKTY